MFIISGSAEAEKKRHRFADEHTVQRSVQWIPQTGRSPLDRPPISPMFRVEQSQHRVPLPVWLMHTRIRSVATKVRARRLAQRR